MRAVLSLLVLGVVGCAAPAGPPPPASPADAAPATNAGDRADAAPATAPADTTAGVRWRLVEWADAAGETHLAPPGERLSMRVDSAGARVSGEVNCNGFGGPVETIGGRLVVGEVFASEAFCGDSILADDYARALPGARLDGVRDGRLVLTAADGSRWWFETGTDAWDAARAAGFTVRAVGQEPGWALEMQPRGRVVFLYDYGRRRVEGLGPDRSRAGDASVYDLVTPDHRFRAEFRRAPCTDIMSGAPFPLTVRVTLDGQVYHGCGRSL